METPAPRPKPAPPKVIEKATLKSVSLVHEEDLVTAEKKSEYINEKDVEKTDLPPINMKSPDGKRVITVKDVEKGKILIKKGWTVTTDPKTPYERTEHLTNRPFQNNPDLKKLIEQMGTEEKPLRYKNNAPKRNRVVRIRLKNYKEKK